MFNPAYILLTEDIFAPIAIEGLSKCTFDALDIKTC